MKQIKNTRLLFVLPTDLMELKLTVFRANCLGALYISALQIHVVSSVEQVQHVTDPLQKVKLNYISFAEK